MTGEIVPPAGGSLEPVREHAVALVGSIDAVNLTDNPTASAHMSPLAGVAAAAAAGIEPTVQLDGPRPQPPGASRPTCSALGRSGRATCSAFPATRCTSATTPTPSPVGDLA